MLKRASGWSGANVVSLFDSGRLIRAVREASQMTPDEFVTALREEIGWTVPTSVLLAWEEGRSEPPRQVSLTVTRLSPHADVELGSVETMNRRKFLSGVARLGGLALVDATVRPPAVSAGSPTAATEETRSLTEFDVDALTVGSISETAVSGLAELVTTYRSVYGSISAEDLVPKVLGLIRLLRDIEKSVSSPALRRQVTSLIGQAAVMAGLLSLMGRHDLATADYFYHLALTAAEESADGDLLAYVQGSISFHEVRAGRLRDGLTRLMAAQDAMTGEMSPTTSAWFASLGSELHARAGDELMSRRLLEQAERLIEVAPGSIGSWRGVGIFDSSKILAYRGGNLVLLERGREAEEVLTRVLRVLPPMRVKHRCTALGDLALALAQQKEPDQAARKGMEALELATQIRHTESVMRIRRAYVRLQPWKTRPPVVELGRRLADAI
jgi:hypothetical protein